MARGRGEHVERTRVLRELAGTARGRADSRQSRNQLWAVRFARSLRCHRVGRSIVGAVRCGNHHRTTPLHQRRRCTDRRSKTPRPTHREVERPVRDRVERATAVRRCFQRRFRAAHLASSDTELVRLRRSRLVRSDCGVSYPESCYGRSKGGDGSGIAARFVQPASRRPNWLPRWKTCRRRRRRVRAGSLLHRARRARRGVGTVLCVAVIVVTEQHGRREPGTQETFRTQTFGPRCRLSARPGRGPEKGG